MTNIAFKHCLLFTSVILLSLCSEHCGKVEQAGGKVTQEDVPPSKQKKESGESGDQAIDDIVKTLQSEKEQLGRIASAEKTLRKEIGNEATKSFARQLKYQHDYLHIAYNLNTLLFHIVDATRVRVNGGSIPLDEASKWITKENSVLDSVANHSGSLKSLSIRQHFTKHHEEDCKILMSRNSADSATYISMEVELNPQTLDSVFAEQRTVLTRIQAILNTAKQ